MVFAASNVMAEHISSNVMKNQGTRVPQRERDKSSATELKDMKCYNPTDKEFKIAT